jgi:hypothetical protein
LRERDEEAFPLAELFDAEFAEVGVLELVEDLIRDALLLELRREMLEVLGLQYGFQFFFHG